MFSQFLLPLCLLSRLARGSADEPAGAPSGLGSALIGQATDTTGKSNLLGFPPLPSPFATPAEQYAASRSYRRYYSGSAYGTI